jgi:transcriptional regulator with XRE-family HTH domain
MKQLTTAHRQPPKGDGMRPRLKELRLAHGLSQDELSALTGLRQATISRVERGGEPAASTVKTLAEFFKVPGPYLMGLDLPTGKVEKKEKTDPQSVGVAEEAAAAM